MTATGFDVGDTFVVLGAIVTAAVSILIYWKRRRDAVDRLRRAIVAELVDVGDSMYPKIDQVDPSSGVVQIPDPSPIVTTVFDNNAGELGRLSTRETELIVRYYTTAVAARRKLKRLPTEEELTPEQARGLYRSLVELNNQRNAVLRELRWQFRSLFSLDPELPIEPEYEDDFPLPEQAEINLDDFRDSLEDDI